MNDKFRDGLEQDFEDGYGDVPTADDVYPVQSLPNPPTREMRLLAQGVLVPHTDGGFIFKRFVLSPTGIQIPRDCDGPEWEDLGWVIKALDTSISWVVGDWALYAMQTWGLTAGEIAKQFGYETGTIETYTWVCRSVLGSIRNRASSFGHARVVAKLAAESQIDWLNQATQGRWTVSKLYGEVNKKPDPPLNWKSWKDSGSRIEKALKGKIKLSQEDFESEIQKFVNQARVLWIRRQREE